MKEREQQQFEEGIKQCKGSLAQESELV